MKCWKYISLALNKYSGKPDKNYYTMTFDPILFKFFHLTEI